MKKKKKKIIKKRATKKPFKRKYNFKTKRKRIKGRNKIR